MDIQDFCTIKMCETDLELAKTIADKYAEIAGLILRTTSPSAHRTAALRLLLESKMTMIHSISRA